MKNSHNIKLFLGIVFLALGITSCLKDDKIDNLEYSIRAKDLEINKIIEFPIISHLKSLLVLVTMRAALSRRPTRIVTPIFL